jgi:hypothetical protein
LLRHYINNRRGARQPDLDEITTHGVDSSICYQK